MVLPFGSPAQPPELQALVGQVLHRPLAGLQVSMAEAQWQSFHLPAQAHAMEQAQSVAPQHHRVVWNTSEGYGELDLHWMPPSVACAAGAGAVQPRVRWSGVWHPAEASAVAAEDWPPITIRVAKMAVPGAGTKPVQWVGRARWSTSFHQHPLWTLAGDFCRRSHKAADVAR